ncbi:MAG: YicC/YloC family endoribonuclease [Bacillota bacterium]
MIKSMTGYGRGEAKDTERHFTVEIKSVNHRYNDFVVRMPKRLTYLEEKIKDIVKDEVKRGRVEIYIGLENIGEGDTKIAFNAPLAKQYYDSLDQMRRMFNLEDDITISLLSKLPDVFKLEMKEEDEDAIWQCLKEASLKAVNSLMNMRIEEGNKLVQDILKRCDLIEQIIHKIEKKTPDVIMEYKVKLKERIKELLEDTYELDDSRLSMEVAIYADKSNITEEIVRLFSHITQLKNTLKKDEPVGRKLDFLIQEMNREINTIGSKSNDLEITNDVVEVKSELEKIREQIQNIE